jgi:hypothetical protein
MWSKTPNFIALLLAPSYGARIRLPALTACGDDVRLDLMGRKQIGNGGSMAYSINDVPLIPQSKDKACWYASAQMVIQWRRRRMRMTEASHPDPAEVPELQSVFAANDGLPFGRTIELAKDLGLVAVPPMTPGPWAIESWLRNYGPLWFAGLFPSGHAVVITGITAADIQINDPWPPNVGRVRTLSYASFGSTVQPLHAGPSSILEAVQQLMGLRQAPLTPNLLHLS